MLYEQLERGNVLSNKVSLLSFTVELQFVGYNLVF